MSRKELNASIGQSQGKCVANYGNRVSPMDVVTRLVVDLVYKGSLGQRLHPANVFFCRPTALDGEVSQFGTSSIVQSASVAFGRVHSGASLPSACKASIAARQPSRIAPSDPSRQSAAAHRYRGPAAVLSRHRISPGCNCPSIRYREPGVRRRTSRPGREPAADRHRAFRPDTGSPQPASPCVMRNAGRPPDGKSRLLGDVSHPDAPAPVFLQHANRGFEDPRAGFCVCT